MHAFFSTALRDEQPNDSMISDDIIEDEETGMKFYEEHDDDVDAADEIQLNETALIGKNVTVIICSVLNVPYYDDSIPFSVER